MEVLEQDPELKHLILHSEATQEDISSECQTPTLFGHVSKVTSLQDLSVESVIHVETTQDDVSISECETQPFASPVIHDSQPESISARTMVDSTTVDTNPKKDFIQSIADAPILQPPRRPKESSTTQKDQHLTTKHTEAPLLRRPSAVDSKVFPPKNKHKHSMPPRKETSPSKSKQKLTTTSEKSIKKESPKVPLAFAIMAGEVSVELPDPDDPYDPTIKAVCDDDDDDDSDSD